MKRKLCTLGLGAVVAACFGLAVIPVDGSAATTTNSTFSKVPRIADLPLSSVDLAKLVAENQLVVAFHPQRFEIVVDEERAEKEIRFFTSLSVIDAPPSQVREQLTQFDRYPDFMAQVEDAEVEEAAPEGDRWLVEMEIELDFKIISISTEYDAEYRMENGDLVWRAVDGDTEGSVGRWEFLPLSGERTLLAYTSYTNFDEGGFILRTIMGAQPDLKLALPASLGAVATRSIKESLASNQQTSPKVKSPTIPLFTKGADLPVATIKELATRGTIIVSYPEQTLVARGQEVPMAFVSAIGLVDAPWHKAKSLSTNFKNYKKFFPQVKGVDIEPKDNGMRVSWHLGIDFGVISVPVNYTHRYVWVSPEAIAYRRIQGDLEFIYGAYEWVDAGDGKTLFFFTAAAAAGENGSSMVKLTELVPNSQMILGISSSAIILEKQIPWIEKQWGS